MPDLATNVLYYGDNLDILRRYLRIHPPRSVTLRLASQLNADHDQVLIPGVLQRVGRGPI
jgi:hypothetical protein